MPTQTPTPPGIKRLPQAPASAPKSKTNTSGPKPKTPTAPGPFVPPVAATPEMADVRMHLEEITQGKRSPALTPNRIVQPRTRNISFGTAAPRSKSNNSNNSSFGISSIRRPDLTNSGIDSEGPFSFDGNNSTVSSIGSHYYPTREFPTPPRNNLNLSGGILAESPLRSGTANRSIFSNPDSFYSASGYTGTPPMPLMNSTPLSGRDHPLPDDNSILSQISTEMPNYNPSPARGPQLDQTFDGPARSPAGRGRPQLDQTFDGPPLPYPPHADQTFGGPMPPQFDQTSGSGFGSTRSGGSGRPVVLLDSTYLDPRTMSRDDPYSNTAQSGAGTETLLSNWYNQNQTYSNVDDIPSSELSARIRALMEEVDESKASKASSRSLPRQLTQEDLDFFKQDLFVQEVDNYTNDLMDDFKSGLMSEGNSGLSEMSKKLLEQKMVAVLPHDKILEVMDAVTPNIVDRIVKEMVKNLVENLMKEMLGDKTVEDVLPKMAKGICGCSKPCKCRNNPSFSDAQKMIPNINGQYGSTTEAEAPSYPLGCGQMGFPQRPPDDLEGRRENSRRLMDKLERSMKKRRDDDEGYCRCRSNPKSPKRGNRSRNNSNRSRDRD